MPERQCFFRSNMLEQLLTIFYSKVHSMFYSNPHTQDACFAKIHFTQRIFWTNKILQS